ncbi:Cell wall synthesis protein kre9 precursor [Friedmanniomyces endolithicus]|uniref:Cell wall synthesis protein kre9 n=1 Tax=Friedmanniomyces endolithicus TaxID=329885 RepID=A0AAN6HEG9_9PEZI|nr:Cell wall synthesis protein kre9 precursor [Friedmanniomyces endolithicus]KAK0805531.1 Cell wall synthesis protein kre9 precursor [Friedmanniomyces endolithicus]KAK0813435.1 Cell wall synthesis protein kre9 precursor [Friedmanniomyces endolithicus]KAK0821419.1 Cell wall synthesis protein kre9 precursor [Friedmanniomyces endolithicus]KAK0833359.1 Cell wall synthesis protein kre9 precursor [Friedmanniomyces endolithicus]
MRFRLSAVSLLAALTPYALADVLVTSPAAGAQLPFGNIQVTWKDSGVAPALSALTTYTIQLVVGGQEASSQRPLVTCANNALFSAGSTATCVVGQGAAASTANGFFLQFTSVASEGGTVINYSSRFTVTGMNGVTDAAEVAGVTALNGATTGPTTVNSVNNGAAAGGGGAAAVGGSQFTVPYGLQTGLTKYAPMQPVPPTKITVNQFTPLNPTSAFTIATTWMPRPSVATTLTAAQTFSVSSMENTAAAASNPTGDMAKFLARWKD